MPTSDNTIQTPDDPEPIEMTDEAKFRLFLRRRFEIELTGEVAMIISTILEERLSAFRSPEAQRRIPRAREKIRRMVELVSEFHEALEDAGVFDDDLFDDEEEDE
jgi:hypothetical protein